MKLIIIVTLLTISLTFNIGNTQLAFKNLQKNIIRDEQCIYNPVQCPYTGGFSLPQCFTHPSGGLGQWDACVSEQAQLLGGEFKYHVNYPSDIKKIQTQNNTNCDEPVTQGSSFTVHCKCSGHCTMNGWWRIYF